MHRILMEVECKPTILQQRRLNPTLKEAVKKEILKLLDVRIIYLVADSKWVSLVQVVPRKGLMTVLKNEKNAHLECDWMEGMHGPLEIK